MKPVPGIVKGPMRGRNAVRKYLDVRDGTREGEGPTFVATARA